MLTPPQFVTGFLGRRDAYQVPLALAEGGMLQRFVTGAYDAGLMRSLKNYLPSKARLQLASRFAADLPEAKVDSRLYMEFLQNLSRLVRDNSNRSWAWASRAMSCALRDEVRKNGGHLLLYEPYAWEALTADYDHQPKKVLFHFHLHPRFERKLLDQDVMNYPLANGSWLRLDALPRDDARILDAWRHSDHVICASSFSRSSLIADGMPSEKCSVISYGINAPVESPVKRKAPERFSVLFVGTGLQRKGLHHLLEAWSQAALPTGSSLTLVCRSLDPVLETLIQGAPSNIKLLRGVSAEELKSLFETSALFALPSLVEGFGQVYLEALAAGCAVLGTPHSCLPDLGGEEDGIFLVPAGDVGALKDKLEQLPDMVLGPQQEELRHRAVLLAQSYTWSKFRQQLRNVLTQSVFHS